MDKRTICLLNDSFPPEIDGVANAVVNYAKKHHEKRRKRHWSSRRQCPGADDSASPFPRAALPEHRHAQEARLRGGLSVFTRDRARADGAEGRPDAHALSHHIVPAGALAARRGRRARSC